MQIKDPYYPIFEGPKEFAKTLTAKFSAKTYGRPEAQLKSPVEKLFEK